MKSKMIFATVLLGAAAMMFTSCKDENKANAVFYQTEADAQKWVDGIVDLANTAGVTVTDEDLSNIKLSFYVDNQKLSKTIAVNYHVKNEAALSCDVADFPTFEMDLGKDKSHKCTLKVILLDTDNTEIAKGNMECTIEADKCNIVRFTFTEVEKSLEWTNVF